MNDASWIAAYFGIQPTTQIEWVYNDYMAYGKDLYFTMEEFLTRWTWT